LLFISLPVVETHSEPEANL